MGSQNQATHPTPHLSNESHPNVRGVGIASHDPPCAEVFSSSSLLPQVLDSSAQNSKHPRLVKTNAGQVMHLIAPFQVVPNNTICPNGPLVSPWRFKGASFWAGPFRHWKPIRLSKEAKPFGAVD